MTSAEITIDLTINGCGVHISVHGDADAAIGMASLMRIAANDVKIKFAPTDQEREA